VVLDKVVGFVRQNGNRLDLLRLRRALGEPYTAAEAEQVLKAYQFPDGGWDYEASDENPDRIGSLGGAIHCLRWLREFGLGDTPMMARTLALLASIQAPDGSFYETAAKLAHSPHEWLQEDTLIDRFYFTAAVPMRLLALGYRDHPTVMPAMGWLRPRWSNWELVTGTWYNLWALLCIHPEIADPDPAHYLHCYTTALEWLPQLQVQPLTWLLDALQGAGFSEDERLVRMGIARLLALVDEDGLWSSPRSLAVETTVTALRLLRDFRSAEVAKE
jgi:hypothetical protein